MAATRRAPSVQVYQDSQAYEQHTMADSTEAAVYHALGPLSEAGRNQQMIFEPEYHYPGAGSPVKHPGHSTSPSLHALHTSQFGPVSIPPPQGYYSQSPTKRIPSFYNAPNLPTPIAMTPSVPSNYGYLSPVIDQENVYGMQFPPPKQDFQGTDIYGHKGPMKRTLLEAAPLAPPADARNVMKKHKKMGSLPLKPVMMPLPSSQPLTEGPIEIPSPRSLPKLEEDDGTKPTYKYAQLIGMAILRAPGHRLTLASIYKWISDNFSFYQASDSGWQNSIRHNLSLNKAFVKQERPKDDPGKGNYWAIKPGCEGQFLKSQPKRMADANLYLGSLVEPARPSTAPTMRAPDFLPVPPSAKIDSSRFPDDTEVSSDATIPASDPAIHDGRDGENGEENPDIRSSPPPADIRSSPPPGPEEPCGTPPPVPLFPGYTHSGGHKRKFSRVNNPPGDSGYYSSIESSVIRNRATILTSEADVGHPAKRRGRAEEEIARIRSSSYDSPSKNPPVLHAATAPGTMPSSSPFRPFNTYHVPLTPPVVFKKPAKPVLSISPSTNLRNHRDHVKRLLASPDKGLGHFTSSPLRLELFTPLKNDVAALDDDEQDYSTFGTGSPVARGVMEKRGLLKRPRLERAATTTGVLADITGSNLTLSEIPPSPYRLVKKDWHNHAGLGSPSKFWPSPMKKSLLQQTSTSVSLNIPAVVLSSAPSSAIPTLQLETEDNFLFGIEIPSDSSEAGFDVMQDFAKIGASASTSFITTPNLLASAGSTPSFTPTANGWQSTGSPQKSSVATKKTLNARPQLGRSISSRF